MLRGCCQDPLVNSDYRLPSACQGQSHLQKSVLNHRNRPTRQGVWPDEDGSWAAGNRATTTHSKSGCQ